MIQSNISYNINGTNLPHADILETHLRNLNPRWLLIMDNIGLCRDYAHKLSATNIIARNWALTQGDENVYSKLSPQAWLDARLNEATDGVWLYTANEAGINPRWDIELMKLIIAKGLKQVKLVLGNPSVGTPSIPDWTAQDKREWFQLLDSHRDQFVLGLHEYFCGIAPSGFVGGWPDGSWVDGRNNLHPNYEDRRNWPQDASLIGQLWHCGRLMAVNAAARSFGFMPPRIVITEHGSDDLADMEAWAKKFQPSNGASKIRGWKTCENLWNKLLPGRDKELAFFDNISYLDESVYKHFPNVETQLLYTWSSSAQWNDFDLSEAAAFHKALETYTAAVPVTPAPPPVVTLPPIPTPAHPFTAEQITLLEEMSNTLAADIAVSTARLVLVNQMLKIAKGQSS